MTDKDRVLSALKACSGLCGQIGEVFAAADFQELALRIEHGEVSIVSGKAAAPMAPGASAPLESGAPSRDPEPPSVARREPPTLMGLLGSYAKANHPGLVTEVYLGVDSPSRVTPAGEASAIFTGAVRAADEVQIEPFVPRLCACPPLADAADCLRIRYASHPADSEARRHELADGDECECVCHAEQAAEEERDAADAEEAASGDVAATFGVAGVIRESHQEGDIEVIDRFDLESFSLLPIGEPAKANHDARMADVARLIDERDAVCIAAGQTEGRIEGLLEQAERRIKSLLEIINRDRTGLATALNEVRRVVDGFSWIARGECYGREEHTVETLQREIGDAFEQIERIGKDALRESGRRADAAFRERSLDPPAASEDDADTALVLRLAEMNSGLRAQMDVGDFDRSCALVARIRSGKARIAGGAGEERLCRTCVRFGCE